jgi:hypothetical protein
MKQPPGGDCHDLILCFLSVYDTPFSAFVSLAVIIPLSQGWGGCTGVIYHNYITASMSSK